MSNALKYVLFCIGITLLFWIAAHLQTAPQNFQIASLSPSYFSNLPIVAQILILMLFFSAVVKLILKLIRYGPLLKLYYAVSFGAAAYLIAAVVISMFLAKTTAIVGGFVVALLITIAWLVKPSWFTQTLAASIMVIAILSFLKDIPLQACLIIGIAILLIDVVLVFVTKEMAPLAEALVVEHQLPLMIDVPADEKNEETDILFSIGLGDIVLPGFVVMLAFQQTTEYGAALPWLTIAGYWLGFVAALIVLKIYDRAQPATIYLIPGVFAGYFLGRWLSG